MPESKTNNSPKLDVSKVKMNEHAYERAAERFNLTNKNEALAYFRGVLKKATCIGETICSKGNPAILYAHHHVAIYLSLDLTTIYTVNKFDTVSFEPLKNKIYQLHRKEFNKLDRTIKCKISRLKMYKLESAIELAQLEYRRIKTRSQNVRDCSNKRIEEIREQIKKMELEIINLQSDKRALSKSMVAVV
jgi:hypothetical protein